MYFLRKRKSWHVPYCLKLDTERGTNPNVDMQRRFRKSIFQKENNSRILNVLSETPLSLLLHIRFWLKN